MHPASGPSLRRNALMCTSTVRSSTTASGVMTASNSAREKTWSGRPRNASSSRYSLGVSLTLRPATRATGSSGCWLNAHSVLAADVLVRKLALHPVPRIRFPVHLDIRVDEEVERRTILLGNEREVAADGEADAVLGQVGE